jgi:hypothetical protein
LDQKTSPERVVEEISIPEQKVQMANAIINPKRVSAAFMRLRGHNSTAENIFNPVQRKKTKEMNSKSYMVVKKVARR